MLTITIAQAGQRIDNFLLSQLKGVPRSRIYRALRKGEVRVNKKRVNATYRLKAGDQVRIPPIRVAKRESALVPKWLEDALEDTVLYENTDFMIINKPAGVAVHGGSNVPVGVIEALRHMRPDIEHLFLIHRLDRDTSGCLLLAKHREAMLLLQEKMRSREIEKEYLLLVAGRWPADCCYVDAPLSKSTRGGERFVQVDQAGKSASTRFDVIQYLEDATLLRAYLETGRMHQIRVHAAHTGHPIVGDRKYGQAEKGRLYLHAKRLSFAYPHENSKWINVIAPGFEGLIHEK